MTVTIREEHEGDREAIYGVNQAAFGRTVEPDLVDALRDAGNLWLSLVAETDGQVVGHVGFSPMTVTREDGRVVGAIGLGPLAVMPGFQKQGVGSALVRAGLDWCRTNGHPVVLLLGNPAYYGRFGFTLAKDHGIRWEHGAEGAFQVIGLAPGALDSITGTARYAPQFPSS